MNKACGRCRETKPAGDFYIIKGKLSSYCRACQLANMKEWRRAHLDVARERDHAYYARTRDQQRAKGKARWIALPPEGKARQLDRLASWNKAHPEITAARSRAWAKANPERRKATGKKHRQTDRYKAMHRDRMREARKGLAYRIREMLRWTRRTYGPQVGLATVPQLVRGWVALVEAFGSQCVFCAKSGDPYTLEIEHLTPRSLGGRDEVANFAPACRPCNATKHDKTVEGFVIYAAKVGLPLFDPAGIRAVSLRVAEEMR